MQPNTKLEIYPNKKGEFMRELKRLEEADISQQNRELITKFQNYLFSTGSGELRVTKLSSQMRAICRWLKHGLKINKDLNELNKDDVGALIGFINRLNEKALATRSDFKRTVKQFYRWYQDNDPRIYTKDDNLRMEIAKFYKYLDKEVSSKYKKEQADPNTIITEEEIDLVIEKGAKSPRDKAFLATLHETGCRAAEFLNLRIGSLELKENYAELHIPDGKTGKRVIYIIRSLPFLLRYLDIHSFKDNKNAFLWISDARFNKDQPLLHKGAQILIDRCFNRVKVEVSKKHNFHWFRHSRSTILAPRLNEIMLCKYMGWSIGSRQVRTYCHLSNKQLEETFLSMNGIKSKKELKTEPVKCMCGTLNTPTERYCFKCFRPLNIEIVIQDKEVMNTEINKTVEFMMEMTKNPELMEKFNQFKKQNGG
jgi:integrase/recombinase XerD